VCETGDIRWDGINDLTKRTKERLKKLSLAGIVFREAPWIEEERQGGDGRMRRGEGEVGGGG
jgi:hypothetical protein